MRQGLSRAVVDLRARMRWSQEQLAQELLRAAARANLDLAARVSTISEWENAGAAPSPEYRMLLARIAANKGHEDLAEIFRAPISVWRVVAHVRRQGTGG